MDTQTWPSELVHILQDATNTIQMVCFRFKFTALPRIFTNIKLVGNLDWEKPRPGKGTQLGFRKVTLVDVSAIYTTEMRCEYLNSQ